MNEIGQEQSNQQTEIINLLDQPTPTQHYFPNQNWGG